MRVTFTVACEDFLYAGVVRPFVSWTKELRKPNIENTLILLRNKSIEEYFEAENINYKEHIYQDKVKKVL
ncbi:MAG: hypothetical protein DRJ59_06050 [Thermoprotei archaeon]|nr:MAG: hypothetical protein DRJ59_06050 [Thermoprotei archaeon]